MRRDVQGCGAKTSRARGLLRILGVLGAAACLAPSFACAQDGHSGQTHMPRAELWGELPDGGGEAPQQHLPGTIASRSMPRAEFWGELADDGEALQQHLPGTIAGPSGVNLFVAAHRTGAQRYSDIHLTSGKKRRRPIATSMRLRRADDSNFTNRTRFLARRVDELGRSVSAPQLNVATTGEEFLAALVEASRRAPIANLVVYGHAAPAALFMREDRGFYASVLEVAKSSHIVSGVEDERDEQLRAAGARDLADFEQLLARGEIRFTRAPVIVFAGCGVAGKRDVDTNGIAARMAEITGAKVIASIDVTDQSMARGRDFRNHEYSRRSWVRFRGGETPERLNTRVIDALKQLNFDGDVVAAGL